MAEILHTAPLDESISYILENDFEAFRPLVLAHCGPPYRLPAGTLVYQNGADDSCLYFLLSGIVKMYTVSTTGTMRLLAYNKENTMFGLDHLDPGAPAAINAESVTAIELVRIAMDEIIHLSRLDAGLMPTLLRFYCKALRLMCFDAENQSIDSTTTRLANFLWLYMRTKEYAQQGCIAMSQQDLACAVNASRIQVARILKKLRDAQIVRSGRAKLYILDPQKLLALLNRL